MRSTRERKAPRPLDARRLEELALAYVARFATSAAKVEGYLARKLRERGWEGDRPADPAAIVARFVELGYIDDAAWARARGAGLLRRGYGAGRVDQTLMAAGIDDAIRAEMRPADRAARQAATALAARRRFGPWGPPLDRAGRERQVAAMVRAGHGFAAARAVVDAPTIAAVEEWVADAEAEEHDQDA